MRLKSSSICCFGEFGGEDAVFEAVVVENVGVAGREDDAEAVVADGPGGVFAAGAAAEVGAGEQHGCAFVAREIQHEFGIGFFAGEVAPVVEEDAAEALARESFQELFGHHLIGVDVDAIERRDQSGVSDEGFHSVSLSITSKLFIFSTSAHSVR